MKFVKVIGILLVSVAVVLVGATFLYMKQDKFGASPAGDRLDKIMQSEQFVGGIFVNQVPTPDLTEGYSMWGVLYNQFFKSNPRTKPSTPIPSTKTDLLSLKPEDNMLIWFGHSSFFMQMDGVKILVDPVFSGNASPIPGTVKAYPGTDRYDVADLPDIDVLLISHDHYDHLDHRTILELKEKISKVICGLGIGAHFEQWGYSTKQIDERDWYEQIAITDSLSIHVLPARHFSGRGLKAKNTLWASYLIETPTQKIYVGGDSGYGPHFKEIGEQFGPIDLAFLDNGQYNNAWREIHLHPEEVIQATKDLGARRLFPVHSSKFTLATHPWDEPLNRIKNLAEEASIPLITPVIGEYVDLNKLDEVFKSWWEEID